MNHDQAKLSTSLKGEEKNYIIHFDIFFFSIENVI